MAKNFEQNILNKITRFCAYQERSTKEVREKLRNLQVPQEFQEKVLSFLREENFLNEERFAEAFIRGKFRIKNWGRIKIQQHLRQKGIDEVFIQKALREIDLEEYQNTLEKILQKKYHTLKSDLPSKDKLLKLVQFALSKGYESEIVWKNSIDICQTLEKND